MKLILSIGAYFLIFTAADIKRNKECQIKIFSVEWFTQVILITLSGIILINV